MDLLKLLPIILFGIVGIISMIMAYKNILSKKALPFFEEASGKKWEDMDKNTQHLILAMMRISGLGFLVTGFLLLVFPLVNYFNENKFIKFSIPLIALIYCFGLFIFNYILYKQTKAKTPWLKSIFALIILLIGLIIIFI